MRTMLKITIPTETGNRTVRDGTLPRVLEATIARLKPEATYFVADAGLRSAMIVFDMRDASEVPAIAEPLFMQLDARLEFFPVMNRDDLKKGLAAAMQAL